jgi:hypothetical protein
MNRKILNISQMVVLLAALFLGWVVSSPRPASAQGACFSAGGLCKTVCGSSQVDAGSNGCTPGLTCCMPFPTPVPIDCDPATPLGPANPLLAPSCAFREIPNLVVYVVNMSIIGGALLALGFLIYGGYKYMSSQDDPNKHEEAVGTIKWAVIGLVFAASAYVIARQLGQASGLPFGYQIAPNRVFAQSQEEATLVQIYGQVSSSEDQSVLPGSEVNIYWQNNSNWELWPAENYRNQRNPFLTDSFGQFQFYVPPGNYYLTAKYIGYFEKKSEIFTLTTDPKRMNLELQTAPAVWLILVIVGVPIFIGTAAFFGIRYMMIWQKKQSIRQQTLKRLQRKPDTND